MLSVRFPGHSRLLAGKLWGEPKVTHRFWTAWRIGASNPNIIQGSTVIVTKVATSIYGAFPAYQVLCYVLYTHRLA